MNKRQHAPTRYDTITYSPRERKKEAVWTPEAKRKWPKQWLLCLASRKRMRQQDDGKLTEYNRYLRYRSENRMMKADKIALIAKDNPNDPEVLAFLQQKIANREKNRQWRQLNKPKLQAYTKQWRTQNREKYNASVRQYQRDYQAKRRAAFKLIEQNILNAQKLKLSPLTIKHKSLKKKSS
jgi:hypothetical protein